MLALIGGSVVVLSIGELIATAQDATELPCQTTKPWFKHTVVSCRLLKSFKRTDPTELPSGASA